MDTRKAINSLKAHRRAEARIINHPHTRSLCDCGNSSRTGTCVECIDKTISAIQNNHPVISTH